MTNQGESGGKASHLVAGQRAEDFALAYLHHQGMRLIERNYRSRQGEIDLIMQDGPRLVFVEVRFRSGNRFGSALESINARKRRRIICAASHYLVSRRIDLPTRFDVIALSPEGDQLAVQWIKNAFQASWT